jgi:hypothetical protein
MKKIGEENYQDIY